MAQILQLVLTRGCRRLKTLLAVMLTFYPSPSWLVGTLNLGKMPWSQGQSTSRQEYTVEKYDLAQDAELRSG